jgi:hypothetical protein
LWYKGRVNKLKNELETQGKRRWGWFFWRLFLGEFPKGRPNKENK